MNEILIEIVNDIPLPQRVCVFYRYHEELSDTQIAQKLAVSEEEVKSRLEIAEAVIRAELIKREDDDVKKKSYLTLPLAGLLAPALKNGVEAKTLDIDDVGEAVPVNPATTVGGTVGTTSSVPTAKIVISAAIAGVVLIGGIIAGVFLLGDKPEEAPVDVAVSETTATSATDEVEEPEEEEEEEEEEEINERGNTPGNLINGGLVAMQGDWIYYSNNGLWKMREDGTEKTKLSDDDAHYVNVVRDWVYYSNDDGIWKIQTVGSDKKLIIDEGQNINVIDDWIYYVTSLQDTENNYIVMRNRFYKIHIDGTEKTLIGEEFETDGPINNFVIVDDWVYYDSSGMGTQNLGRMDINGTGNENLGGSHFSYPLFYVDDNWVYYNFSPGGFGDDNIRRLRHNENLTEEEVFIEEDNILGLDILDNSNSNFRTFHINGDGEWVYFIALTFNAADDKIKRNIYKIRSDGSDGSELTEIIGIESIHVIGDWIFYHFTERDDDRNVIDSGVYKIRTDGTEQQLID